MCVKPSLGLCLSCVPHAAGSSASCHRPSFAIAAWQPEQLSLSRRQQWSSVLCGIAHPARKRVALKRNSPGLLFQSPFHLWRPFLEAALPKTDQHSKVAGPEIATWLLLPWGAYKGISGITQNKQALEARKDQGRGKQLQRGEGRPACKRQGAASALQSGAERGARDHGGKSNFVKTLHFSPATFLKIFSVKELNLA